MARNFEQSQTYTARRALRAAGVLAAASCLAGVAAGCSSTVQHLRNGGTAVKGEARKFANPVPLTAKPLSIDVYCYGRRDKPNDPNPPTYPQRVIIDGQRKLNTTWTVEVTTHDTVGDKARFFASARYMVPPSDTDEYSLGPGSLGSDNGHHQPYHHIEDPLYTFDLPDGSHYVVEKTNLDDELAFTCGDNDEVHNRVPIRTKILAVQFPQQEEQ